MTINLSKTKMSLNSNFSAILITKRAFNYANKFFFSSSTNQTKFSGFGNPYETEIKRRRYVENISIPNFNKVECLKWTNWRMRRDVIRRHLNGQYWQYRLNLKNISRSKTLPNVVKDIALDERLQTPRDSSIANIRNRCAISSRSRGLFHKYRLSRIVWRDLADHGLISGAIRAKWG